MRKLILYALLLLAIPAGAQKKLSTKQKAFDFGADHIITFTPISGVVSYGNFNPAVGFDYEYIISRKLGMGIHIPIVFGFDNGVDDIFNNGYYKKTTCFFAAPGIRFHTGKLGDRVDFSTGPSVLVGNMHFSYDGGNGMYPGSPLPPNDDYAMLGLIADNSLSFTRRKFVFALNVKVGTLLEKHGGTHFFMQFGMNFGGIF